MPKEMSEIPMCSDTPIAPYSWKTFFSCCDLLCFLPSVLLTLLPVAAQVLLGSCVQTKEGETLEGRSKGARGHRQLPYSCRVLLLPNEIITLLTQLRPVPTGPLSTMKGCVLGTVNRTMAPEMAQVLISSTCEYAALAKGILLHGWKDFAAVIKLKLLQ